MSTDSGTTVLAALVLALQAENDRLREQTKAIYVRDGKLVRNVEFEYDFFETLDPADCYSFNTSDTANNCYMFNFEQKRDGEEIQSIAIGMYGAPQNCQVYFLGAHLDTEPPYAEMRALFRDIDSVVKQWVAHDPRDFSEFLRVFLAFTAEARAQFDKQ